MGNQLRETKDKSRQQSHKERHPNLTRKGTEKVSWFARNFPQFFTEKVTSNRKAPLVTKTIQPQKSNWVVLVRKVGKKQTSFLKLEKTSDSKMMRFHCDQTGNEWYIQPALLVSMAVMPKINHVSDWTGVRVPGKEDLVVNRIQLLTALRFFKVLT